MHQGRKQETLGERLKRLRVEKGYSQRELAKVAGTSHRMVAYYEVQGGNPPADMVVRLSKALGVSADEFLGLTRSRRAQSEAPEKARLMRKLRQIATLSPEDRRGVIRYIEMAVERNALKNAQV